jgi:hypothetical protein
MLATHRTANTHNKRDPNNSHVGRKNVLKISAIITAHFNRLVAMILTSNSKNFKYFFPFQIVVIIVRVLVL